MRSCLSPRRPVPVWLVILALSIQPPPAAGQDDTGSTQSALAGGALGGYAGTALGLAGAMGPCNRLLAGPVCPRVAAVAGGALGTFAGAMMGAHSTAQLEYRLRNAGVGALVGGVVGLGLSTVVRQYSWPDPVAFAALGAAIGTVPEASGIGFLVGAGVGAVSWLAFPRLAVGDAIAVTAFGTALGGLVGWVVKGLNNDGGPTSGSSAAFIIPLSIPVP